MLYTEDGVRRSVRNCYTYGVALSLLLPFALIASLRTFYETETPILRVIAARTYNNFPLVADWWWRMPYLSGSSLPASVLFVVLVGATGTGLFLVRLGYARQMMLWEQRREAERGALRDNIRRRID
jgi:hypothetical protein